MVVSSQNPTDRAGYLAGLSIVNGIMAADCLWDDDVPMNQKKFREELVEFIKHGVSPAMCENFVAIISKCQSDETWSKGRKRW
jgi:hypothetical protein